MFLITLPTGETIDVDKPEEKQAQYEKMMNGPDNPYKEKEEKPTDTTTSEHK